MTEIGLGQQPLQILAGARLSSIEFGREANRAYLLFRFEQEHTTYPFVVYNPLQVLQPDQIFRPGEPGYRDALWDQVGQLVQATQIIEGQKIVLDFENGVKFEVLLHSDDYSGPEAANFSNDQQLWVW